MSYSITVSHVEKNIMWSCSLTQREYLEVRACSRRARRAIGMIPAMFIPIRTHNWIGFVKDFFLPTTINHAIKVQHVTERVFAILAALFLDVITVPIRLVTCIPRVICNPKKEEHPLYKYLTAQCVDKQLLESDYVKVCLESEEQRQCLPDSKGLYWREEYVNFIDVREYEHAHDVNYGACME